jgi:hypothetical protein
VLSQCRFSQATATHDDCVPRATTGVAHDNCQTRELPHATTVTATATRDNCHTFFFFFLFQITSLSGFKLGLGGRTVLAPAFNIFPFNYTDALQFESAGRTRAHISNNTLQTLSHRTKKTQWSSTKRITCALSRGRPDNTQVVEVERKNALSFHLDYMHMGGAQHKRLRMQNEDLHLISNGSP